MGSYPLHPQIRVSTPLHPQPHVASAAATETARLKMAYPFVSAHRASASGEEVAELRSDRNAGRITPEKFDEELARIRRDLETLNKSAQSSIEANGSAPA